MKPTHTRFIAKYPDDLKYAIGRDMTERELVQLNCQWAGQLGHERCGWCTNCSFPRSVQHKICKHLPVHIYGKDSDEP